MNSTEYTNWLQYLNVYHYYPNPYFWGVLLFFLVPIVLWMIGIAFIRRKSLSAKVFAFISGSDNRLSLSKLQAFAWTLVIFGSFVAAMAIHTKIVPTDQSTAEDYKKKSDSDKTEAELRKAVFDKALQDRTAAETVFDSANRTLLELKAAAQSYGTKTTPAAIEAKEAADAAEGKAKEKEFILTELTKVSADAQAKFEAADKSAKESARISSGFDWVEIPGALLALAGIAIGSGIFSSLISALNSEDKTASLVSIEPIDQEIFNAKNADGIKTNFPNTPDTQSKNLMKISGKDLGTSGKVRFGQGRVYSVFAPIVFWREDGKEIVVDVPLDRTYNTLVVDTTNGKLCYEIKDLSASEMEQRKAPVLAAFQTAKTNAQNSETVKLAKEKNLAAVRANLETLIASGAAANKISEAQDVVNDSETEFNEQFRLLSDASGKLTEQQIKMDELRFGNVKNLTLGASTYYYEFSDLFRDDKNPNNMDLMKFQMFGWTVVAIGIYSWLFLNDLRNNIESLPLVPESIVILTGLSQAGYLAGKGVSNVPSNQPPTG